MEAAMCSVRCALVLCGIASAFIGQRAHSADRELIFPSNFDHARVSLFTLPSVDKYMSGIIRFPFKGIFHSSAKGSVRIPNGAWVGVEVHEESGYQSFIESLPVSGMDRLELHGVELTTSLLNSLERIQSLRHLALRECRLGEIDVHRLVGTASLQCLEVRGEDAAALWRGLTPWLVKCPSVQLLFDGEEMTHSELKLFADRTCPTFLTVKLDSDAENTFNALQEIPGLVGISIAISDNVSQTQLKRLTQLNNIELIVLSAGVLDSNLTALLAKLPKLKVLRVQGSTTVSNFFEGGFHLKNIEAFSFTRPLPEDLHQRFVEECLKLERLRELPRIRNATAKQLSQILNRSELISLEIDGLDKSADESLVAEAIKRNPHLSRLSISRMQLTSQLGSAISGCSELDFLRLGVEQLDIERLNPVKQLSGLSHLRLSSTKQPKNLIALKALPNLRNMEVSLDTFDPQDCATLASIPSLETLDIDSGLCDDATMDAIAQNPSLRSFACRQYSLVTDRGLSELLQNKQLSDLHLGGYISESAVSQLQNLPNLKYLTVNSDATDDAAKSRLQQSLRHLDLFEVLPLQLSLGNIVRDNDNFERLAPDEGRSQFDELEGKTLASLVGDNLPADIGDRIAGKCTLVEFWGTWCGPCLAYNPELERLYNKYQSEGLQIISVHSQRGKENASDYLKSHTRPWADIVDETGEVAASFNVSRYPALFLFDSTGKLVVAQPHRLVLDRTIASVMAGNKSK